MLDLIRAFLTKSFKSWTVVASLLLIVLTSVPSLFQTVIDTVGADSPAVAAKLTAGLLLLTRLRSILGPILTGLLGKESAKP